MDYGRILGLILDVGAGMIRSGAETHRVEDSLYRLCASYGFSACNIWVVPSNIQATVTASDGVCLTQIRHIRHAGVNFERLDQLNDLSRRVCADPPGPEALERLLQEALRTTPQPVWINCLAGVLAGAGFGVFFNCDGPDALVAVCAALLITFLIRAVGKREENPLILNFLISCVAEFFIILSVRLGFGHHTGYITLGVVMLLISALGATNGLRDLVHLDTLSGVMNITASLTGAIGIALGIALPLSLLRGWAGNELTGLNPSVPIQLISCTIACVGFALWFHVRGRQVPWCGLGALLTWAAYRVALQFGAGVFTATLFASAFCGLYGQVMARVNRAPATIFLTVSIFPLIPGAALYYMMYGIVTRNAALSIGKGAELLLSCFGIVLGYMAVEVLNKYIWRHHGQ